MREARPSRGLTRRRRCPPARPAPRATLPRGGEGNPLGDAGHGRPLHDGRRPPAPAAGRGEGEGGWRSPPSDGARYGGGMCVSRGPPRRAAPSGGERSPRPAAGGSCQGPAGGCHPAEPGAGPCAAGRAEQSQGPPWESAAGSRRVVCWRGQTVVKKAFGRTNFFDRREAFGFVQSLSNEVASPAISRSCFIHQAY